VTSMYNYESIKRILGEKGCILDMSEVEFAETYKNTKSNVKIISDCGHQTTVQLNNFIHKNTGITCKLCKFESKNKKGVFDESPLQKHSVIKGLQQFCHEFEFKICNKECLTDFAIRPKHITQDSWLPLQLKTIQTECNGVYRFGLQNDYRDMNIMFFAMDKQRVWIINYSLLKNLNVLSIDENSSDMDIHEIGTNDISKRFQCLWDISQKHTMENINCMTLQMQMQRKKKVKMLNLFISHLLDS